MTTLCNTQPRSLLCTQAEEGDRPFWNFVESWGVRNRGEEPCWRQLQRFAGERLSPAMAAVRGA